MPNLAKIIIAGHAGSDAELTQTQQGTPLAKFSVAVNNRDDSTTWYRVSVWRKYAEIIAPLVKKGATVTVLGRFQPRTFTGNDGVERWSFDVDAEDVIVAGGVDDSHGSSVRPAQVVNPGDDIPF